MKILYGRPTGFSYLKLEDIRSAPAFDEDWLASINWSPPVRDPHRTRIVPRPDDIEGTCTVIEELKELTP